MLGFPGALGSVSWHLMLEGVVSEYRDLDGGRWGGGDGNTAPGCAHPGCYCS